MACFILTFGAPQTHYMDGDSTSGDGSIVDPWNRFDTAAQYLEAGDTLVVRASTMPYLHATAACTLKTSGTAIAPIKIIGYSTIIGDIDTNYSKSLPLPICSLTTAAFYVTGNFINIYNIDFRLASAATIGALSLAGYDIVFINNKVINSATSTNGRAFGCSNQSTTTIDCFFSSNPNATTVTSPRGTFRGCVVTGGQNGIMCSDKLSVDWCVIFGTAAAGFVYTSASAAANIENSTFFNIGSDAILASVAPTVGVLTINNTVIDSCAGYGVNNTSGAATSQIVPYNCRFRACNGGGTGLYFPAANGLTELTTMTDSKAKRLRLGTFEAIPFTNAAAGDFSIKKSYQSVGSPGKFRSITTTGYVDVGAVQHPDSVCSGGGNALDSLLKYIWWDASDSQKITTGGVDTLFNSDGDGVLAVRTFTQSGDTITRSVATITPAATAITADTLIKRMYMLKYNKAIYFGSDSTWRVFESNGTDTAMWIRDQSVFGTAIRGKITDE